MFGFVNEGVYADAAYTRRAEERSLWWQHICGNIGTKCNSLTQQFIRISATIDTWATCFDSIESSSGPQRLQIQLLQGGQVHCGIPNAIM